MSLIALGLTLLGSLASPAQEDLDSELEGLAPKIAPGGGGATLAALLRSDAGRLVIKERIAALVAKSLERIDRDPQGQFERLLFSEEADGTLRLRPERKREIETLGREIERRAKAWAGFNQAGEEIAAKIPDTEPIGKKLKEYWRNPDFRLALYQRVAPESREPDAQELWNSLIGRSLFRGGDGKLRLRGNYKDESVAAVAEVKAEAQGLAAVDDQVTKVLGKLADDERRLCATPEGRVVIARRLAQLAEEGAPDPAAKLLEAGRNAERSEIAALAAVSLEVKPILDEVVKNLADETEHDRNLKKVLQDPRAVALLAAKMKATLADREANRDAAIGSFRDDYLDSDGSGRVTPKKGRFVNDQGQDSVDALAAEFDGILAEAAATRETLDELSERTLDPALGALLHIREGASAFTELQSRVIEDLKQAERDGGVRKFVRIYLEASGDRQAVRAERAARVQEMALRAKEVQKALEAAGREEVGK